MVGGGEAFSMQLNFTVGTAQPLTTCASSTVAQSPIGPDEITSLSAEAFTMEHGRTVLTEAARSVHLLEINGYCATGAMDNWEYIKSRWNVDGHEWEVRLYPADYVSDYGQDWVTLNLILLSESRSVPVRANLSCRLVDPSGKREPSPERSVSHKFLSRKKNSSPDLLLMKKDDVASSGYLNNDSLTVQCTITVLKEVPGVVIPAASREVPLPPPLPSSDLHRHLGELLQGQKGADVTFVLDSGDSFPAHKNILAARSSVFMAEFFGHMNERTSQTVRIDDMQADVFKAMLHFIYTDMAPELYEEPDEPAAVVMAQHLLAAADRYGIDRLKLICEGKLSTGIDVETAATTLALAEQHNCSVLKAKCVDFIARSPETLNAVLATDGYKHLVESCPLVLTELLKVAHGRN